MLFETKKKIFSHIKVSNFVPSNTNERYWNPVHQTASNYHGIDNRDDNNKGVIFIRNYQEQL